MNLADLLKKNIVMVPVVASVLVGTFTGVKYVVNLTDTINANKAEIQELKSLYKHDQSLKTTNSFISSLRASVRPVITYFFFFMFVGVEVSVIFSLVQPEMIDKIWNQNTQGLFAAVLSFWFGSRAMSKVMKKEN